MGRIPRLHYPGAIAHVTARGNNKQRIFHTDADYSFFLSTLEKIKRHSACRLYAYCLMPNHIHLLIQVCHASLSTIMHRLLLIYAKHFNAVHDRVGHVFQKRFYPVYCRTNSQFLEQLRYIHQNPVRSKEPGFTINYPWSSHAAYAADAPSSLVDTSFPLSIFGADRWGARDSYMRFMRTKAEPRPEKHATITQRTACIASASDVYTHHQTDNLGDPLSLEQLGNIIEKECGVPVAHIRSGRKSRYIMPAKRALILRAAEYGHSTTAIAHFLGCSSAAVSKANIRP